MSIEVSAVGGFVVKLPEEVLEDSGFTNWDDLFEEVEIDYGTSGGYNEPNEQFPVLVPTPVKVDKQIDDWLKDLNKKLDLSLTLSDVKFVTLTHWW